MFHQTVPVEIQIGKGFNGFKLLQQRTGQFNAFGVGFQV